MRSKATQGFTILELIVVLTILAIVTSIATVNSAQVLGQLRASQDIHELSMRLGALRSDAMRLRATIAVSFTPRGYSWDIYGDGTIDGSVSLSRNSTWLDSPPAPLSFNGLGLARGIESNRTYSVENRGQRVSFTINSNSYIQF